VFTALAGDETLSTRLPLKKNAQQVLAFTARALDER
jgi:hypothetical protein